MRKNKKKKKGFTLVELLAVIVVLAIILVIAVPKILDVIKSSRENSLISSVKLIARNAEQKLLTNEVLGENTNTLSCDEVADINTTDYKSCNINVNDETKEVTVTIEGQGKFNGYTCSGTKNNVTCGDAEPLVCTQTLVGYKMKNSYSKVACVNKFVDVFYGETDPLDLYYRPYIFGVNEGWPDEIRNAELDDLFYSDAYLICNNALDGVYADAYSNVKDAFEPTLGISSVDEYITFLISNGQLEVGDVSEYVEPVYECALNCSSGKVLKNNRCVSTNTLSNEWFDKAGFTRESNVRNGYYHNDNTSIKEINFYSDGRQFDGEAIDVSENEDNSVKLYFNSETGVVNIVSNKIISFPEDSSNLFYYLVSLKKINFNDSIDTSGVLLMYDMFFALNSIDSLDLSEFEFNDDVEIQGILTDEGCSMWNTPGRLLNNGKFIWPKNRLNLWKKIELDFDFSPAYAIFAAYGC